MNQKLQILLVLLWVTISVSGQSIKIGDTHYTTLMEAVTNASAGDVINLSGTITENTEIIISKNLTLKGDGMETTVLQPSETSPDVNSLPTHTNISNGYISVKNSAVVSIEDLTIKNVKHEDVDNHRKSKGSLTFTGSASVTLKNVIVEDCWNNGAGGAVYAQNTTAVSFENCIFRNIIAENGGGVAFIQNNTNGTTTSFSIKNCLFENNLSSSIGGRGGALSITTKSNTAVLEGEIIRCTFIGNDASKEGEALYFNGEGLKLNCYNNTIAYNETGWAVYFAKQPLQTDFSNNIVANDNASNDFEKDHSTIGNLDWLTFKNNLIENISSEFSALEAPENNSFFNVSLYQLGLESSLNPNNYLELQNTSLAINSGLTIASVTDAYNSTAPDMGAWESDFTSVVSSPSLVLNPLFADDMILQQNTMAPIWGTGNPGETITISGSWGEMASTQVGNDSKWSTQIQTPVAVAGQANTYALTFTDDGGSVTLNNVAVGEVWICSGQSNMVMPMSPEYDKEGNVTTVGVTNYETEIANANYDHIRFFHVKGKIALEPEETVTGTWKSVSPQSVVEEDKELSAVAYFFARELQKEQYLDIPIGLIQAAVGATGAQIWISRAALSADEDLKTYYLDESDYQDSLENGHEDKTYKGGSYSAKRYNAMIHPLAPFAIKGVIWYQGENNRYEYDRYTNLLSTLITDWRSLWNRGDFPFYYVEIAPWTNKSLNDEFNNSRLVISALHREAMAQVANTVSNAGMVSTLDLGETSDIHPPHKQDVGLRLALLALKKTYGFNHVYIGPKLSSYNIEDGKIRLHFEADGVGSGLIADGGELNHFKIAGDDDVYYDADAFIDGSTVVVSSPSVSNPKNASYGFDNALDPRPNFKNAEGIAAFPFRTVNFDGPSVPAAIDGGKQSAVSISGVDDGWLIQTDDNIQSISVFDVRGKSIYVDDRLSGRSVTLSAAQLPKGILFITVTTQNGRVYSGKVLN